MSSGELQPSAPLLTSAAVSVFDQSPPLRLCVNMENSSGHRAVSRRVGLRTRLVCCNLVCESAPKRDPGQNSSKSLKSSAKTPEVGVPIDADRGPTRNKKWGDQRAGADAGDELGGGTGAAVAPSDEESGRKGAIIRSSGNREVVRRRQRSARRCASTRTPSRPHRNRTSQTRCWRELVWTPSAG